MSKHILDRPIWNALSTRQSHLACGSEAARRFVPEIGPLAASRDDNKQSLEALAELLPPVGKLLLMQAEPIVLSPGMEVVTTARGVQMVADRLVPFDGLTAHIERLSDKDIPSMYALASLTKPGPFEMGTPTLGDFWGIKDNGSLIAMAGERLKHIGYTELSGVCTHPNARGKGYARALSAVVAKRIIERGETPYLHAYATNTTAIQLYESLGFRLRSFVHVALVGRQNSY